MNLGITCAEKLLHQDQHTSIKVVSALPIEHSPSFQAWSSLPKYRWIASAPQIQMRGL